MDTPQYIKVTFNAKGEVTKVAPAERTTLVTPTLVSQRPPPFISTVFTGAGKVLAFFPESNIESANFRVMRRWAEEQAKWDEDPSGDPPMWDRYILADNVYKRDR